MLRSAGAVAANPLLHLGVTRGRRGDKRDRAARLAAEANGELGLAAPGTTRDEDESHQKSMPRIARTPRSNACLRLRISVTVSASSMSAGGASRPVAITFTDTGRAAIAATTSSVEIQPQFIGYVISSSTTRLYAPAWIFSWSTRQACRAIAS